MATALVALIPFLRGTEKYASLLNMLIQFEQSSGDIFPGVLINKHIYFE